jgi:putative oxidoreductase
VAIAIQAADNTPVLFSMCVSPGICLQRHRMRGGKQGRTSLGEPSMFQNLKTSLAPFILRIGLAAVFLYHGILKILMNGGTDWSDTLPTWFQVVVAWVEVAAGAAIAIGLLSRLAALGITTLMMGAILTTTGHRDFVHIGTHYFPGKHLDRYRFEVGYEYNFVLIAMSLTLIVLGSGKWSVDYFLFNRKKRTPAPAPMEPVVAKV